MKQRGVILSSFLGNALEFYDFTLYASFAVVIGQTFFVAADPLAAALQSLAVSSTGFIMRPFGAAFFGFIGDRLGRKRALQFSILLMGIPTLVMGLLPGYAVLGGLAPVILVICRLLQGLCTGGEYNGAGIFALEHVGRHRPGLVGGLITASCGVGAFVAMGFSVAITLNVLPEWAWRVPFLLGTAACFWGWFIRRKLDESPAFRRIKEENALARSPLRDAIFHHKKASFVTLIVGATDGILSHLPFMFVGIYLELYRGVEAGVSRSVTFLTLLVYTFVAPLGGLLLDRLGRQAFMRLSCIAVAIVAVPGFYCLQEGELWVKVLGGVIFAVMSGGLSGGVPAFIQNLFPTKDRYSGISFSYNVGLSLGGSTPLVLTTMLAWEIGYWGLGLYMATWALVCLGSVTLVRWR